MCHAHVLYVVRPRNVMRTCVHGIAHAYVVDLFMVCMESDVIHRVFFSPAFFEPSEGFMRPPSVDEGMATAMALVMPGGIQVVIAMVMK